MVRTFRFFIPRLYLHIKKHWEVYVLAALCTVILVSHSLYVIKTHQYPEGGTDEHQYMEMAVIYYDFMKDPKTQKNKELFEVYKYRQPLYSIVLASIFLITGVQEAYKIALLANIIFYLASVISVYFLAKEFLSKAASLFASFIFAFYGFPLFYLHFTYTETAATAFVVMSLLFLAKSKNFTHTKNTILFSIFLMLGNLTRWVVPIFVVGPLMIVALFGVNAVLRKPEKRKTVLFNTGIFFMLAILPSLLLFYLPNLMSFKAYIAANTGNGAAWVTQFLGMPQLSNVFSPQSVFFYLNILAQLTIFFWLLFVAGFLVCFISMKRYAFFLLAFIVPYTIFTFGSVWKEDRFITPLYPVVAIISAVVFDKIKNKFALFILVTLTIVIGLLNFLGASWGVGPMKFSITGDRYTVPHSILIPMPIGHPRRIWFAPISWPPRPEEGNAKAIIAAIKEDWKKRKEFVYLPAYAMSQLFNGFHTILAYQERGIGTVAAIRGENSYDAVFKKLQSADYVLVKNGIIAQYKEGQDDNYDSSVYYIRRINDVFEITKRQLPQAYVLVKKVSIPFDKSTMFIYRKKRSMTKEEWMEFAELFITVDPEQRINISNARDKILGENMLE